MLEAAWDHLLVDAEDAADCANFVSRAPYPAFHLLREEECIGLLHAVDKRVTGFELPVCLSAFWSSRVTRAFCVPLLKTSVLVPRFRNFSY